MPFKAILFDADGMIIIAKRFSDRLQAEYGISWSTMEPFFKGPFQKCKVGQADLKEELSHVIHDWGWKGSVEELVNFWFQSGTAVDERMREIIQNLRNRGTRCYLTSNQEKYRANFLRHTLNLSQLFDELFISADIGYLKQDQDFFEFVYRSLTRSNGNIQKHEILFADDSPENIHTAEAYGLTTHLYHTFEDFKKIVLG